MALIYPGPLALFFIFFFNDTATTEIYTLSLHDALPISISAWRAFYRAGGASSRGRQARPRVTRRPPWYKHPPMKHARSEEHTSELQSQSNLVCRLLLEKKKKKHTTTNDLRTTPHHNTTP